MEQPFVERFFQQTWFLWWVFALAVIVRWYWINPEEGRHGHDQRGRSWRELHREALMERAPSHIASRITEACGAVKEQRAAGLATPNKEPGMEREEAILYELLAHPFKNQAERRSLQDTLANSRAIRDNLD